MLLLRLLPALVLLSSTSFAQDWAMTPAEAILAVPALANLTDDEPGGTLVISLGDSLLHEQAFGLAHVGLRVPCTIATRYPSKNLLRSAVQVLALEMAEEGTIDLDTKVSALLPALAKVPGEASIGDLLTREAKFHSLKALLHFRHKEEFGRIDRNQAIEVLGATRSTATYVDLATNDIVLSAALEAADARDLGALLKAYVFEPAGMTDTVYTSIPGQIVPGGAQPFDWNESGNCWQTKPADQLTHDTGTVWVTAKDAHIFALHFQRHSGSGDAYGRILSEGPTTPSDGVIRRVQTVRFAHKDLCVTWISSTFVWNQAAIPSTVAFKLLGWKDEQAPGLGIGGGGGSGPRVKKPRFEGTFELGSFELPEIDQALTLFEDRRGRLFVSTVGVQYAPLKVISIDAESSTMSAYALAASTDITRLTPLELAAISTEERRSGGYTPKGVRRTSTTSGSVTIQFEIAKDRTARPVSVELSRYLPDPISLRGIQVKASSKAAVK